MTIRSILPLLLLSIGLPIGGSGDAQSFPEPRFTEIAASVGLDYEHGFDGLVGDPLVVSGGVAAGDFDGDGRVDLYVVRGDAGPNLLFRNREGPLGVFFEEVGEAAGVALEGAAGSGPAFADLDGDGRLDLVIGGAGGEAPPRLFRNLGAQAPGDPVAFEEITDASGVFSFLDTMSAAFGDYDLDGDLDMFLSHWSIGPGNPISAPHLWRNNGAGGFDPVDFSSGIAPAYQNRDWSFAPAFSDVDDDGFPDLLVTGDFGTTQVFRNLGDGTFAITDDPVITDENGMGAAIGDVDNDGDLDWFVTSIWDSDGTAEGNWGVTGNRLYRNHGDWSGETGFEDATDFAGVRQGFWGWAACFADFDNDGDLDLFHTNGFPASPADDEFDHDPSRLFLNDGTGVFVERSAEAGVDDVEQGRGVVCFDMDLDGDVDLFVANHSGPPRLYRNDSGNSGNFLQIRLRGEGLNSEAIGARVSVRVGDLVQTREIRAGSNYVSQNPTTAHFGVGDAQVVDEIRIRWPGGEETGFPPTAANQRLHVDQSAPLAAVVVPTLNFGGVALMILLLLIAGIRALQSCYKNTARTAL